MKATEQDIVYEEIQLVKKAKCIIQFLLSNVFTKLFKFQGSKSQSIIKHNNETCDSEPSVYGEIQLVKKS